MARKAKSGTLYGITGVVSAIALSTSLGAQDVMADEFSHFPTGYYIGAQGGYNIIHNPDLDATAFNADTETSGGGVGTLSVGYQYDSPWRAEIEAGYRTNGVDEVTSTPASGDIDAFTAMANIFYDFEVDAFSPYVGIGVGLAYLNADNITPVNGGTVDHHDFAYAGQLILGAAYEVSDSVALTGQYTFLAAPDVVFDHSADDDVDSQYYSHAFMLGLRYMFGAPEPEYRAHEPALLPPPPPPSAVASAGDELPPEPPPPPPPLPEPDLAAAAPAVKNFIIFFDWDSAVITPNAMSILSEAAEYTSAGNFAVVTLTGHTDTSGSQTYNQALSERRAAAAKMILVQQGVTSSSIETSATGENNLAVPTADGVREGQNRRVEIRIE